MSFGFIALAAGASAATSVAVGAAGLTLVSGVAKADAQYKAGRSQKRQAFTEAQMVEQATIQADNEARQQIARLRRDQRSFTGEQRARMAGAGVVSTVGSPMDILGRTAALQELQIQDMARTASTAYSSGFAKARQIRVAGKAALSGAKRAALGTQLSTAANLASNYLQPTPSGGVRFGVS